MPDVSAFPIATLGDKPAWASSLDAGALAALSALEEQKQEQAGVFVKNPSGQFAASNPTAINDHDNFGLRAQIPKDHSLAGIWHTHLGNDPTDLMADYFSPHDIEIANKLGLPSYVRFPDGSVRKYVPGVSKLEYITAPGSRNTFHVTRGDPVTAPTTQD